MSGKPALAVALLTVTLGALRLQPLCAQVLPLTSRQLAAGSSHVVVAVVEDARSRWNPERTLIVTEYDLRIEDRLQGDAPERVTLAVPGGTVGRETHDTSLSTHLEAGARYLLFLGDLDRPTFTPVTGGWQGGFQETAGREGKRSFGELVRSARAVIAAVEARPEPADTVRRRPEDPGLPAKTYGRLTRLIPESAAVALSRPVAEKFIVRNAARAPIVFNTLLPGTPFSSQDQKQMTYWNLYAGDLFRVSPHPSPHWAFGNGVFDIAGFPSSEQMQQQFDMAWDRFAYSLTAWRTVDGHIVEADLAFNPAFQWTVDDVRSTQSGGPLSFKDALLSNLGTAWGYRGLVDHGFGRLDLSPVTRDSIKNLKAPPYDLATLFAEDAAAARSTYGGSPIRDGVVSPYGITPAPLTPLYVPVRGPTGSVRAGSSFSDQSHQDRERGNCRPRQSSDRGPSGAEAFQSQGSDPGQDGPAPRHPPAGGRCNARSRQDHRPGLRAGRHLFLRLRPERSPGRLPVQQSRLEQSRRQNRGDLALISPQRATLRPRPAPHPVRTTPP